MSYQQQNKAPSPKVCQNLNCDVMIIWDNTKKQYMEVNTQQRHNCQHWQEGKKPQEPKKSSYSGYSSKSKEPMENALEILIGTSISVKSKYDMLSDLVSKYNGKVHGSQSHIDKTVSTRPTIETIDIILVVYYEVPIGKREELKRQFKVMNEE